MRARPILKASSDGRATIQLVYTYMYIMRKRTRVIIIPATLFFLSQTTTKIKPAENSHRSTACLVSICLLEYNYIIIIYFNSAVGSNQALRRERCHNFSSNYRANVEFILTYLFFFCLNRQKLQELLSHYFLDAAIVY